MAHRKNSKDFYAEVESVVANALKGQCKKRGQIKQDAVTAAIRVWLALPRDIQAELIDEPPVNVYEFLVERLLDAATIGFLRTLPPEARQVVFASASKAIRKASGER